MRRIVFVILTLAIFALLPVPTANAQGCVPRADWIGTHTVARGENLYRIALKYNLGLQDLAMGNCIADVNRVFVGQKLRVPGPVTNPPQYFSLPNRLVQVYSSPSRATLPIADLANVQIMLIGRTQDANWVYMQTKELSVTGWMWAADTGINAAYITPLPVINGGGDQSEISALVPGQYNRLRAGPGFQHRVITYLHNQMVIVRGRSVDSLWLSVDANGTGGWIYRDLVQIDAATVSKLPIFGTD